MLLLGKDFYAGIGSRETPGPIQKKMKFLAGKLYQNGLILRSGNAKGADRAFQSGCPETSQEIFVKKDECEASRELASRYHPKWSACDDYARALHARNAKILLGEHLNTPVDFVVCWTVDGKATGGTGLGMRIAKDYKIPIYNLYYEDDFNEIIYQISLWGTI